MYEQYPISRFDYDVRDYIILFPLPHLVSAIATGHLQPPFSYNFSKTFMCKCEQFSSNLEKGCSVSKLMKEGEKRNRAKERRRKKIVLSRSKFNLFVKTGNDRQRRRCGGGGNAERGGKGKRERREEKGVEREREREANKRTTRKRERERELEREE